MTPTLSHVIVIVLTGIAAVFDWRTGRVPNWLTMPLMGIMPVVWYLTHGWTGVVMSGFGLFACGVVPLMAYRMGGMFGADVKIFASIGATVGPTVGIEAQFFSMAMASLYSLVLLAWRGKLLAGFANLFFQVFNRLLPKKWRRKPNKELREAVRVGPYIFAGTLVSVLMRHPTWLGMEP
jgi:prepilin peptidase CpaA